MANILKPKRRTVDATAPTTANLADGELAVNTFDKKIYMRVGAAIIEIFKALTKTDVGLSNVDNTSDANKPVSTAQQTALNLKANLASPTFTGTVSGITPTMLGLGNVNNTSDAAKPVSTAQQTALNLKANIASPTFTGTVGGITKAMVGLGSVDNTTDAAKPISTATQTALNGKAPTANPAFTGFIDVNASAFPRTTGIKTASATILPVIPGGSAQLAAFEAWNKADTANGGRVQLYINGENAFISTDKQGTGTTPTLLFTVDGVTKGSLLPNGTWEFDTAVKFKTGYNLSNYSVSSFNTGNAYGRIRNSYDDPHDNFSLATNYNRTGAGSGAVDNQFLGTAEVLIQGTNSTSGRVILRAGNPNTAPADQITVTHNGIGFFGGAPVAKYAVTGSRSSGAALASLLDVLHLYGLITNNSTP